MSNIDYESLPTFLKNLNSVLDDSDEKTEWISGKPDYSIVNALYDQERTKIHPTGSLEDIITNLIKNWEKELSHKANPSQWLTVVPDSFRTSVNGGPWKTLKEVGQVGAYNAFLGNSEFYSAAHISDPHSSHQVFRQALKSGFALEILEVYTPPPRVVFKFRHWGYMSGELKCPVRNGEMLQLSPHNGKVEIFGITVMKLTEKFQILEMEFFFRPDTMMEQMVLAGR